MVSKWPFCLHSQTFFWFDISDFLSEAKWPWIIKSTIKYYLSKVAENLSKACLNGPKSRSKWAQKAGLNGPKKLFFCFFLKTCHYIHLQILKNNYFSLVLQKVLYCPVKFGLKSIHLSQLMSCKSTHVSSPINSSVGF